MLEPVQMDVLGERERFKVAELGEVEAPQHASEVGSA